MGTSNEEVARLLEELAALTMLDEGRPDSFRVRAYQNAQRAVQGLEGEVADLSAKQLAAVKGIGTSIAGRIREYLDTGRIERLEQLREQHPPGQLALLKVPGLGPKTVALLDAELGVREVEGLVVALDEGRVAELPGMGERRAQKLREAVEQLGLGSKDRRVPLADALPVAERLLAAVREVPGVVDAALGGSVRRFREDIGDVDVLVASDDPGPVHDAVLTLPEVDRTLGSGPTKTSVVTRDGIQLDLRVVTPDSFGAALVYFTGSKAHNIRLRQRALERELSLNEYALVRQHDEQVVASRTEQEVYGALDLPWIPPELREDDGELEAADAHELPRLPEVADLRGDLHDHTDRSGDGRDSLEVLVEAAYDRGLDYLAITDHAEDLRINGVSRQDMLEQRRELRKLEQRRGDIRLLHGAELNIGLDGDLDYDPEFLAGFDWLVASVHSHFGRGVREQTDRIVAAMREPSVTAIGHLTGRLVGRRPGIELDLDAVLDAAVETGTAIEINASLQRLDAPVGVIREGHRRGVRFVISTDAHAAADLDRARFGVAQARRAGLPVSGVANSWPTSQFLAWVEQVRTA